MHEFRIKTGRRCEMINIDHLLNQALQKEPVKEGICTVYTPHTTAAITINENADPAVAADINSFLSGLIPARADFRHQEGNSDAHIKSSLVGASETVIIDKGRLLLGTWQAVYFCEFDGPRSRTVYVKISS